MLFDAMCSARKNKSSLAIGSKYELALATAIVCLVGLPGVSGQTWKEDIGYNRLVAEKALRGESLENGSGVTVLQPEAPIVRNLFDDSDPPEKIGEEYIYMPHAEGAGTGAAFTGITFTNGTNDGQTNEIRGHAAGVGNTLYGRTNSIAPGITEVTGADANDYLDRYTGFRNRNAPIAQDFDISNHSYIGNISIDDDTLNDAQRAELERLQTIDLNQRHDFIINRDNTVAVAGANNGSGNSTPDIWAPSYNGITVGRSNGGHSRGETEHYGPGRFKPDIVAPTGTTSNATPIVSGAAAILIEAAQGTDATKNQVIRSMLYSGATKDGLTGGWNRLEERPKDKVYGFGQVDIYNSYKILEAGQSIGAGTVGDANVQSVGWDFQAGYLGSDLFYNFDILPGAVRDEFSAVLSWNIETVNSSSTGFDIQTFLADLNLDLIDLSDMSTVDQSLSTLYNNEHIYASDLDPGSYALRVSGDTDGRPTDFALSWRVTSVPEPASAILLTVLSAGAFSLRRHRQ